MKPFKITALLLWASIFLATSAIAKPNLPPPIQDVVKMEKMAGDPGPFTSKDNFPKGYLLIPKNLPFLVGLSLYDSSSSNLELSQKQIDALLEVKKGLMPELSKKALVIKNLELEVVNEVGLKYKSATPESQYAKIDTIAKLKADMTKAHLGCIQKVKNILTKEQFEELLDYGVVNMF